MSRLPSDPAAIQALIEQKRREVAERLRQMQGTSDTAPMAGVEAGTPAKAPPVSSEHIANKLAEVRARVQQGLAKQPILQRTSEPPRKSGLAAPAHPLIAQLTKAMDTTPQTSGNRIHPQLGNIPKASIASIKANQRVQTSKKEIRLLEAPVEFSDPTKNPYYDPNIAPTKVTRRAQRGFNFVGHGTYIRQGEKARAEAHMERLRNEIAKSAQRAGMEVELDIAADKLIRGEMPPEVEWWDEPLLATRSYSDIQTGNTLLAGDRSVITHYVQHPVPIPGPQDTKPATARPLLLTTKEKKKLRRQRRMEELKEKQDKIRLGLLPPEPPKVKMSNLMRVLGNEAIQDPTKMENFVRNEMRKRNESHERTNEERKLTDQQRRDKRRQQLDADAAKGIQTVIFRVNSLAHPLHKSKVEANAHQLALTGVVIISTRFSVVIVEGGPKSIRTYKKLMLRRIKWDDPAHDMMDTEGPDADGSRMDTDGQGLFGEDEATTAAQNRCMMAWEGQTGDRAFRSFRFHRCPTDSAAKEILARHRVEHYWDIARTISEEDALTATQFMG